MSADIDMKDRLVNEILIVENILLKINIKLILIGIVINIKIIKTIFLIKEFITPQVIVFIN